MDFQATGPLRQATGLPRSGAGMGVGLLRVSGGSLKPLLLRFWNPWGSRGSPTIPLVEPWGPYHSPFDEIPKDPYCPYYSYFPSS